MGKEFDATSPPDGAALLGIEDAAALLAAIVASSNDAILSKTLDGTITSWNAATARLFGYSAAEMVGKSIRLLIPDDRQEEEDTIIARISAGERIDNYETRRLHKNGSLIDVSVTISPVRNRDGKVVGASKIIRDISDRKASEQRIQLLLREVNHRSKNMLALVQAIAQQTAPSDQRAFLSDFIGRIKSLAISQDLLVEGQWEGMTVKELVAGQLRPFDEAGPGRIEMGGPALDLNPAAAQNLGMAIYELVTNAARYGALSTRQGRVEVRWRLTGDRLNFSWTEREGPPVIPPTHNGYGSQVLTKMIERGLSASVSLAFPTEGVTWILDCPLGAASARS